MIPDPIALRCIEEWTGHRKPHRPMKPLGIILLALVSLAFVLAFAGCTTVTTTAKDGTVTTIKAPAPGVLPFAGEVLRAYSPRPIRDTK